MSEAKKDRDGKPDLSLIPYCVEAELARAMMFGAKKYGRYNYCKGHSISDLIAANKRHMSKLNSGEDIDAESGVHHAALAMANCLMLLHQRELGTLKDDRHQPERKNVSTSITVWQVVVRGSRAKGKVVACTYPNKQMAEVMARDHWPSIWPSDSFAITVEETTVEN